MLPGTSYAPLIGYGEAVGVAFFVAVAAVWIAAMSLKAWRRHRESAYNARLKQMMIERGMSADEIERVIRTESKQR